VQDSFRLESIEARLSVIDKNIGTSARFYAYTGKSHTKKISIFLTGGAYAPYATCMAMPLLAVVAPLRPL